LSQYSDEPIIDVDRQRQRVGQLLEDPTLFPVEFLSWLKRYIEQSGITLPASSIIGGFYAGAGSVGNLAPGIILPIGGATPPTGSVICDGTSYPRATYPKLFAEIDVVWGSVDAASFNVPDLRGRSLYGAGGALVLGAVDAAALVDRGPVHRHTVTDPGHKHDIKGSNADGTSPWNTVNDSVLSDNWQDRNAHTQVNTTGITVGPAGKPLDAPAYAIINYVITTG
jgi:microcystin-dependent protein